MTDNKRKVLEWLANGDTGVSSKSLAFEFLGIEYQRLDAPYDPYDLGRCLVLISIVPEIRKCVDSLALKNERWERASIYWDIIAKSMEDEVGIDWRKGHRAPKTCELMENAKL